MDKIGFALVIFAFVCFCLAAWQATAPHWNKLVAAGLAFLAASIAFGNMGLFFK